MKNGYRLSECAAMTDEELDSRIAILVDRGDGSTTKTRKRMVLRKK